MLEELLNKKIGELKSITSVTLIEELKYLQIQKGLRSIDFYEELYEVEIQLEMLKRMNG